MTYLHDLNTYLHQSSLLIQAYPATRISSKYSLPRKTTKAKAPKPSTTDTNTQSAQRTTTDSPASTPAGTQGKEKREPSATLTLKTYHPESGICLKYRTDKAQEVGRLIGGLGRLAKGETIDMPSTTTPAPDKMDIDDTIPSTTPAAPAPAAATQSQPQPQPQTQTQGAGGKKKKKGKK